MRQQIEASGIVAEVGSRVGLEGMDHVRELDRVANEEGRKVVTDQVPVTVGGVKLGGEATWVAQGFRRMGAVHNR
ncbi:hypothetical protein D3C78_1650850 [compost metagenome]